MMILERLKKIFAALMPDVNTDSITTDSLLTADLGITSISVLLLVIGIEEEFGITFDSVKNDDFKTVGDVCDYIKERIS